MAITNLDQLDISGSYTYADYLKWQLDERIEIINGKIYALSPAPGPTHQLISDEIHYQLNKFLRKGACKAFAAPFDVRLTPFDKQDGINRTVFSPTFVSSAMLRKLIKEVPWALLT